jgi:hypothetical protein
MAWSNYTSEPNTKLDPDFVINKYLNLDSNHKFDNGAEQAPLSLGIKGPTNLRGRTTAYKVTT